MTVLAVLSTVALVVTWWWRWSSRNGCGRRTCEHCRGPRPLPKKQPSWPRMVIHYGWTLLIFVAGEIADRAPRRWLPDSFVAWYNRSLDSWTWNPVKRDG